MGYGWGGGTFGRAGGVGGVSSMWWCVRIAMRNFVIMYRLHIPNVTSPPHLLIHTHPPPAE